MRHTVAVDKITKSQLRAQLRAARGERDPASLAAARSAIRATVIAHCRRQSPRCVAAYVPLRTEPGSCELLDEMTALGIQVLVPILLADRDLNWRVWSAPAAVGDAMVDAAGSPVGSSPAESSPLGSSPVGTAPLGIEAISRADLVLVPASAVALDGTRLGRGGGSYDRVLHRVGKSAQVAALLFDGELLPSIPRDDWDQRVDSVITPSGWRSLTPAHPA